MKEVVAVFLAATFVYARPLNIICGTHPEGWKEEVFLHRQATLLRAKAGVAERRGIGPAGTDMGDIAVMYDAGGVVARRNVFNLVRRSVIFEPASPDAATYRFHAGDSSYDEAAAASGELLTGLGDDDTRRVPLPFSFPFFGAAYSNVFVNSDGNLSFGSGDTTATSRSLGFFTGGPPRIGGLLTDLDPTRSRQGVRVLSEESRFVVSFVQTPLYASSGVGALQTFQMRLYPDGRIEFAYDTVSATDAVVGITPGGAIGSTSVLDFLTGSEEEFTASIAERFSSRDSVDTVLLAQRFYESHDDAYDYIAVFNNMGIIADPGVVAKELTVRSTNRAGFGDTPVEIGRTYGSASRLQAMLTMGPLSQYPRDPNARVPARSTTGDTPLTILAHEAGHLFLALASIRDENDPKARPMLGAALAHWAFTFNSEASFLEGNRIQDNGPGTSPRFTTVATVQAYAPLDQYLMGFRAPEEVPPTFLVRGSGRNASDPPSRGVSFNGERQDITVDDVIAAEGRRAPDHTVAQRRFRMAFVLVVPDGSLPSAADLSQIDTYRTQFETLYATATSERAAMETALRNHLRLSVFPAAGLVRGATLDATVSIDRPAAAPLTVMLTTQNGFVCVPASVTIAEGSMQATVNIRATRAGVEVLTATPEDSSYITTAARMQVAEDIGSVRLELVSGGNQIAITGKPLSDPIRIRATDVNLIPYPGLRVRAAVTEPGTVEPNWAVTDDDGVASFRWTPAVAEANELTATIECDGASLTVSAMGVESSRLRKSGGDRLKACPTTRCANR